MKYKAEHELVLALVKKAGEEIVALQQTGFDTYRKQNRDLLTTADLKANEILKHGLLEAFPEDGWLSEETQDDEVRLAKKRVWVVDPIDGTKEYVHGIPEYAISVALVEDGVAVLGVVYNPVTQELFHAVRGEGCYLNETQIYRSLNTSHTLTILASRSEEKRGEWDSFKQAATVKVIGSIAYKLGLVAAGLADATFSLGPKSEWDIAAGVCLIEAAGGVVTDKFEQRFTFNRPQVRVTSIVAAGNKKLYDQVTTLIKRHCEHV